MYPATIELLEQLTEYVLLSLRTEAQKTEPGISRRAIHIRITLIREALNKARHEQKGGTP